MTGRSETEKHRRRRVRLGLQIMVLASAIFLMANLNALVDYFQHPEIDYLDEEHLIVGIVTAIFTSILIAGLLLYYFRFKESVENSYQDQLAAVESDKKYRDLFEKAQEAIFKSTPDGYIKEINPAGVELFGYDSRSELTGVRYGDFYVNREEMEEQQSDLERYGFVKDRVINMKKKDGSWIIVSLTAEAISDQDGNIESYNGTIRDVTSKVRMEQQLTQAQNINFISRMTGGIAHDFNNYLTAIQGYIDLVLMELPEDSPEWANINEARQAAEGASELTGQLLLFSGHQPAVLQSVNLNNLVMGLEHMIERLVGDQVRIMSSLADDLSLIDADSASLTQVIVQLALNANANLPHGGEITFTTCNGTVSEDYVASHPAARQGEFATLSVTDSGVGFSNADLEQMFEPFRKDESSGEGEVFGLSMVYRIILRHDGWIDVDSIPGMGTTFTIFLPAVKSETGVESIEPADHGDYASKGERILLVEDDESVRAITEKILSENGYTVIGAHDAAEAFARFAGEKGDIQLVFSDVVLPGDNGIKLVENLKSHKPELAVLLASGYADTAVDWQTVEAHGYRFLQKPYVMPELLKTVRELLSN